MEPSVVFRDVVLAVAKIVFRIPPNEWQVFDPDLVPSKRPPDGLGASRAAWPKTLNGIEGELHAMNPLYRALNLGPNDANKTIKLTILAICTYIQRAILKSSKSMEFIADLEEKTREPA